MWLNLKYDLLQESSLVYIVIEAALDACWNVQDVANAERRNKAYTNENQDTFVELGPYHLTR